MVREGGAGEGGAAAAQATHNVREPYGGRVGFEDDAEGFEACAVGKGVHHVLRVPRRRRVESEEAHVVAESVSLAHLEGVADELVRSVVRGQREHQVAHVVVGALAHVVDDVVRAELELCISGAEPFLVELYARVRGRQGEAGRDG